MGIITTLEAAVRNVGAWQAVVAVSATIFFFAVAWQALVNPKDPDHAVVVRVILGLAAAVCGVALLIDLFQ